MGIIIIGTHKLNTKRIKISFCVISLVETNRLETPQVISDFLGKRVTQELSPEFSIPSLHLICYDIKHRSIGPVFSSVSRGLEEIYVLTLLA